MASRLHVLALAGGLVAPGCGDDCGDGEYRDAEICFNEQVLEVSPAVDGALALRAADFDGDGHDDVLVIGAGEAGVAGALHRGDGEGHLEEARDARVGGCSAYPVDADVDADGASDLLFATCVESLLYYRSDGAGGFLAPVEIAVGVLVSTTFVADVTGDGVRDILALGGLGGAPSLSLVAAAPDGFSAPVVTSAVPPGLTDFKPAMLAAGRLRRDGPLEIVLGEPDRSGGLALVRSAGAGLGPAEALATGLRPGALALRDLDDDDVLDLLILDRKRRALAPLLGPDLTEGPRSTIRGEPRGLALAHLDGDGTLDAILVEGAGVGLWRGRGDGRFDHAADVAFPAELVELALPDLNGDGRADLVAGPFEDEGLVIRLSGP